MGDFNMSLFKVVPELRSCGLKIDLIAWYPWKTRAGKAMADSCGIFLINKPCAVTLDRGPTHLHCRDDTGIGHEAAQGYRIATPGGYDVFDGNAGPGMPLETYLPKSAGFIEKILPSLTPDPAVAEETGPQKQDEPTVGRSLLRVGEKRLEAELWKYRGENYKGSHFPICAFTNNVGRRSNARFLARSERSDGRWKSRRDQGRSERDSDWRARPQWRGWDWGRSGRDAGYYEWWQ